MRKRRIALCDGNEKYVFMLEEYLRGLDYLPFVTDVYTEYERYLECDEKYHYAGALIAEQFAETGCGPVGGRYLILTEEKSEEDGRVYRYRSADALLQDLMKAFFEEELETGKSIGHTRGCCYIGLYSPDKRCLQTSFALVLGQFLAKRSRVLYLNFETYSGWDERYGISQEQKEDMADLLYYYKNLPEEFASCFKKARGKLNELDYIRPSFSFLDLQQMEEHEWGGLLAEIGRCGPYDYILLDLSDSVPGILTLLRGCDRIYSMQQSEDTRGSKRGHYERLLRELHADAVLQKTKWCVLPRFSHLPENPGQMAYSELADYIRSLMREETEGILNGR